VKRTRRKTFAVIEDLATHPEANLAVEQLAAWWAVEVQTVRKWIRLGKLPAFRVGGRAVRVKRIDALAFEDAGKLKAAS
jgi:excisionase family DNA binding protein